MATSSSHNSALLEGTFGLFISDLAVSKNKKR